jgi:serine protease
MIKLAALLLMLSVVCQDSLVCRGASLAGARFQSRLIFGQEAEVIARGFFILRSSPSNFWLRFFTEDFICEEDRVLAVLGKVPSDTLWRFQSSVFSLIKISDAWLISTGSKQVVIGVLDSGVQRHEDLESNIFVNQGEILNGRDDDGNGYIDDRRGANTVKLDGDIEDSIGHGTHVAGIIGAVGNNKKGIAGVNWKVTILPIKVVDSNGAIKLSSVIRAYNYALDLRERGVNIRVLNASFGGYRSGGEVERAAIRELLNANVILVAAAGNDGINLSNTPIYPASYNLGNVVSVGSIYASNGKPFASSFSNFGRAVKIGAPGENIPSTFLENEYALGTGTSMATPVVAGALGLYFSVNKRASVRRALSDLYKSCRKYSHLTQKIKDGCVLDVAGFLKRARRPV